MNNNNKNIRYPNSYMNYRQNVNANPNFTSQMPPAAYLGCGPVPSSAYGTTHVAHQTAHGSALQSQSIQPMHLQNQVGQNMLNQQQASYSYPYCSPGGQFQAQHPYPPYPNQMMNNFNQYPNMNCANNPHSYNYNAFNTTNSQQFSYDNQCRSKSFSNTNRVRNNSQLMSDNLNRNRVNESYSSYKDRNSRSYYDKRRSRSRSRSHSRHRNTSNYQRSSSNFKDNRRDDRSSRHSSHSAYSERDQRHRSDRKRSRSSERNSQRYKQIENEPDKEKRNLENETKVDQNEYSYVQTTLIPIYYTKDSNNVNLVRGTSKLIELCEKFENEILARSRTARQKANLGPKATKIPDYRQLAMKKFAKCTCDQPHSSSSTKADCSKHRYRSKKASKTANSLNSSGSSSRNSSANSVRSGSSDSSSSASSVSSLSSSSSDSSRSTSSNRSSRSSTNNSRYSSPTKNENSKNEAVDKQKKVKSENEYEDIRSMELRRKQNHPERLHSDLCFNEPDQTNEGPLCKCKLKNTTFGTRHQIYFGEQAVSPCDDFSNNIDKLFHYRMSIKPFDNFVLKHPTTIQYDKHKYAFEGYSIFSHEPLENIPECVVVVYNNEYKLSLVKEEMTENCFTIKELELLKQYVFVELLELYDLKWKGYQVDENACNRFHVMPRYCRTLPYNGKEILSPCEILKYFLENNVPVISSDEVSKCNMLSNREWLNFIEPLQGSIVTCPGKRPSSIRLDQLDRDNLMTETGDSTGFNSPANQHILKFPLIIHFSMYRNTWLPMIKNNLKLKKLYHKYFKLRHLINNKSKPSEDDKSKLRSMENQLQQLINKSSEVKKEMMIELSSENFLRTGIRTDVVQQSILIPTLVEHLRFHVSLQFLENKINYKFKNRLLLQYALTHPSGAFLLHQNLGSNPDHIRNVLFNCKVRNPNYGCLTSKKRKNLLRKKGIHTLFSIMAQKANDFEQTSLVSNYERLEFLGDKILELLTSKHLFSLFPAFDEGQLSEYRNAIVQNQYLAVLARKLDLHFFILFYHGVDLCSNSALNHALANSFEALLAAIYLDSDLETVADTLAKTLWSDQDQDLLSVWTQCPPHPIQSQMPDGDRHLISNIKILQHVNKFEEMIGVEFKHIRLLAQAFSTRSASFNLITLGDNQRLEFLGDTVLNFVVSEYLYRYFPNHHEGHLSLLRSSLVCNSTQALLYDELGMSDFVINSFINNRTEQANGNLKRKADVFEAFVGALYLDQGLDAVRVFCNVCMFNKLQDIILYQFWNDPKSRLQQCCLSLRDVDESKPSLPTYKLVEEKGPPNNKQYRVAVYFNRKRLGEGLGKSIHDAEVEAAKNALKKNANMFPILNKYIADEFKMSKYFRATSVKSDHSAKDTKQEDETEEQDSRANSYLQKKNKKPKRHIKRQETNSTEAT